MTIRIQSEFERLVLTAKTQAILLYRSSLTLQVSEVRQQFEVRALRTWWYTVAMIRPATQSDSPALLAITAGTGFFKPMELETLEDVLKDYYAENAELGHRLFVWEEKGRVLGYVYHAPEEMTDRTWCLWWIAVAAEQQGRGLGGKLLAFVEADIRAQGGRLLVVETSTTDHYEPTRRFYLKYGYTAAAQIADFYADGDGMAVFTKRV